jgi:DNA-binding Xre family transcriptional regulator
MPATWKLREVLKERGANHAAEISRIVLEQTGYQLSTQAVCDLLNRQPKMIRLETIQALCDAFYFRLSDVLEVLPMTSQKRQEKTRRLERPGLQYGKVRNTKPAQRAERAGHAGTSPGSRKIDFAAFYPNAREFSSDS